MTDGIVLSRNDARARGMKRYFTGKPCKHGHVRERQVSDGNCVECALARARAYNGRNPGRGRAINRPPPSTTFVEGQKRRALRHRASKTLLTPGIPSAALLHEWLLYDHATGIFRWKKEPRTIGYKVLGKVAGARKKTGYVHIGFPGYRQFSAHRAAWMYVYGVDPGPNHIDHKDTNRANNAIDNLRLATPTQNLQNKGVQPNSRSGLKGAYYQAAKPARSRRGSGVKEWTSGIKVGSKIIYLGRFYTAEEAHQAYAEAAKRYFGEFARAV